jgi:hypothetical protein
MNLQLAMRKTMRWKQLGGPLLLAECDRAEEALV